MFSFREDLIRSNVCGWKSPWDAGKAKDLKGQQKKNAVCNCQQLWVAYIDYICNIFISIVPFPVKLPESCPFPDQMPAVRQKALEVNEWCMQLWILFYRPSKVSEKEVTSLLCLYRTFLGLFMVTFFPPLDFSMVVSKRKTWDSPPRSSSFLYINLISRIKGKQVTNTPGIKGFYNLLDIASTYNDSFSSFKIF